MLECTMHGKRAGMGLMLVLAVQLLHHHHEDSLSEETQ